MKRFALGMAAAAWAMAAGLASPAGASDDAAQAVCSGGPYIVFFGRGEADVSPAAATILDSAIAAHAGCNAAPIALAGHTDTSGSDLANMDLSTRRDDSVRAYLASHGVQDGKITSKAFGETMLRVPTADGVHEAQNRRVEVTFSQDAASPAA